MIKGCNARAWVEAQGFATQTWVTLGFDVAGAASTVQGNLATHVGQTGIAVHGLGSASTHAAADFDVAGAAAAITLAGLGGTTVHSALSNLDFASSGHTGFEPALPPGCIQMYGGASAPTGWVLCDGASYLRAGTYANLYAVIGTTFGSADDTHFNVPDMRGRAPIGVGTGTGLTARALGAAVGEETHLLTSGESGVPAHTHPATSPGGSAASAAGTATVRTGDASGEGVNISASANSTVNASSAHNNMPPSLALNFIIKI